MTTLPPYKGFQAAVDYDDGVLLVRLLHLRDSVTATCNSADEVIATFHDLVDDYLETCAEFGEEPNRPFKGSFNVRVDPPLHRDAAMAAAAIETTLNQWVEEALREKLQRQYIEQGYLLGDLELHQRRILARSTKWVARREQGAELVSSEEFAAIRKTKGG